MTSAAAGWRRHLEEWALPEELLDAVEESPYGWSPEMWRRRSRSAATEAEPTKTAELVRSFDPESVLDIGAGRGRASLPLAREGRRVVMVEPSSTMLDGLAEELAATPEVDVRVVEGRWPDVAGDVSPVDVAMTAHVVYDVADIGPFVDGMHRIARKAGVVEMTTTHPWSNLTPYYRAIHQLHRPAGPTAADLAAVVQEVTGVPATVERWTRSGDMWFESMDEIVSYYGRRLLVPPGRRDELRELLTPDVLDVDGRLMVHPVERELATVWWPIG